MMLTVNTSGENFRDRRTVPGGAGGMAGAPYGLRHRRSRPAAVTPGGGGTTPGGGPAAPNGGGGGAAAGPSAPHAPQNCPQTPRRTGRRISASPAPFLGFSLMIGPGKGRLEPGSRGVHWHTTIEIRTENANERATPVAE